MFPISVLVMPLFLGLAVGHECIRDWTYFEGSCYGFGEAEVTWGDAQAICKTLGATLAEIESKEEDNFLITLSKNKRARKVWLGASDMFHEGHWRWTSTQETFNRYSNWARDEPNDNAKAEECLQLYGMKNFQWNDDNCSNIGNFICETHLPL